MAYFKILPILRDKYVDMGMINVSAELYLEQGDEGYDKYIAEHFVTVPVIPAEGYQGKVDETGQPIDQEDYDKWISSLPTIQQLNPFCNHSIQFEANVTEEEILWCFEWALGITHRNYLMDDLHCEKKDENGNPYSQVVNQPFGYTSRRSFYEGVRQIPVIARNEYEKKELAKCVSAEARVMILKDVDFTAVETIVRYQVK